MLAAGNIHGPVFCDRKGGFLRKSNITRQNFARCIRRANAKATKEAAEGGTEPALLPAIRFHDLRHTAATLLLQANVNIKVVSERLGHERIQITLDTYSHVLPGIQEIAAGAMEKVFNSKTLAG